MIWIKHKAAGRTWIVVRTVDCAGTTGGVCKFGRRIVGDRVSAWSVGGGAGCQPNVQRGRPECIASDLIAAESDVRDNDAITTSHVFEVMLCFGKRFSRIRKVIISSRLPPPRPKIRDSRRHRRRAVLVSRFVSAARKWIWRA